MVFETTHTTHYLYQEPVVQCLSEARLTPRLFTGQRVLARRLQVHPEPASMDERVDYFGNRVHSFSIFRSHGRFTTVATSVVDLDAREPGGVPEIPWEQARDEVARQPDDATQAAYEFTFESPFVPPAPEFADYARLAFRPGRDLAEAARELCSRIHRDFTYLPKSTAIDMPLLEVFRRRCGVCQDFSHVMIAALRSLRLPTRYVSGYIPSGANFQGAEASHAWVSVFVPGGGWLAFDPTNDVMPAGRHITLGWGRDYGDVTPLKGIALGGGHQTVEVEVRVQPLEAPR